MCRFMEENGLPTTYRDQIADYIVQHTGLRMPIDPTSNPDPFTGGGAYVPGSSAPQPGQFRGSGSASVTGGGVDPFTGACLTIFLTVRLLQWVLLNWDAPSCMWAIGCMPLDVGRRRLCAVVA